MEQKKEVQYLGLGWSQLDTHFLSSETFWRSRIQLLQQAGWELLPDSCFRNKHKQYQWSLQTSGSFFNWRTPDVICKWKGDKVEAPRFTLIKVLLLCIG